MLFGVTTFTLNKYQRKETNLKNMEKRYGKIDEKKLSKSEGFHYFFVGGIFIIIGIITNSTNHHISFTWVITFILLGLFFDIIYHLLRKKYLGIK